MIAPVCMIATLMLMSLNCISFCHLNFLFAVNKLLIRSSHLHADEELAALSSDSDDEDDDDEEEEDDDFDEEDR